MLRKLRAGGVALLVLLLGAAAALGTPWLFYRLGIGTGYAFGTLRSGHAEYAKSFDLTDQARSRTIAYFVGAGAEVLELEWHLDLRRGEVTIAVDEFLGGGMTPLWRERRAGRSEGRAEIAVQAPGFYQIRMSRTRWAGEVRVDWRIVDGRSSAAGQPCPSAREARADARNRAAPPARLRRPSTAPHQRPYFPDTGACCAWLSSSRPDTRTVRSEPEPCPTTSP